MVSCSKLAPFWLVAILSVACASPVRGQQPDDIRWITQYSQARRMGTETERPVLLFLTMDGCYHCVRMKNDAFRDRTIIDQMRRAFVPAMVNLDADSDLARQLKVTIYPTTVIISPDGKILDYARGYLTTQELHQRLQVATRQVTHVAEAR